METRHRIKEVIKFLKLNGFKEVEKLSYTNDLCNVVINLKQESYEVSDNTWNTIYSENLSMYWLIGALTYYGYMDKNYKQ